MKRQKPEYPRFPVGSKVTLLSDILRTPLLPTGGYGDPYVLVEAGTVGEVTKSLSISNYTVDFPSAGGLFVYALRLKAAQS